ncbi:hypothetical protein VTK56DRAFT_6875 [Thermocarpiscus australiensis]
MAKAPKNETLFFGCLPHSRDFSVIQAGELWFSCNRQVVQQPSLYKANENKQREPCYRVLRQKSIRWGPSSPEWTLGST